ncbi:hypothetical protein [Streptomyces pini]|uniref:hypothetical protein n=1 Tax=Streptomyces pini TaxID=1520580 RepID=UPI00111470C5|nr:hypothetical protein [Streptomyces pini]
MLAFRAYNPTDMAAATSGEQSAGLAYKIGSTWIEALTVRPTSAAGSLAYTTGNQGDTSQSGSETNAVYSDTTPLYVLFNNGTDVVNTSDVEFQLVVQESH